MYIFFLLYIFLNVHIKVLFLLSASLRYNIYFENQDTGSSANHTEVIMFTFFCEIYDARST